VAIDHNDFERSPSEGFGGRKSTKPRSDDDDARAGECLVGTVDYRVFLTPVDAFPTVSIVIDDQKSLGLSIHIPESADYPGHAARSR
jgi:hypothetical protein